MGHQQVLTRKKEDGTRKILKIKMLDPVFLLNNNKHVFQVADIGNLESFCHSLPTFNDV